MKDKKNQILHSEPVKEIMGSPPAKLVAWGTTIIFVVFLLFIVSSWYIKYPDVIPARVEITTVNPPVMLTSRINGRIVDLMCSEGDTVDRGEVIAVLESSASHKSILSLEQFLESYLHTTGIHPDSFPVAENIGEIQQSYSEFMVAGTKLYNAKSNDYLGHRIEALRDEITATEQYINRLKSREILYKESIGIEVAKYRRDSSLHIQNVLSQADLERAQQTLIAGKIELQETGLEIMSETINLSRKKQDLQDLSIRRNDEFLQLESETLASKADLLSDIAQWKNRFLLISPVRGSVTYTRIWSSNQFVTENEAVVTVVPEMQGDYVGRLLLGTQKSGKVRPGMIVNIKLSGFPYLEYGMVRGIVISRSAVPEGDNYYVEISLPEGLKTLYGKDLPFSQNMSGTAEIMTDDLNLLRKIVDPLRYLITRYRQEN
jgi:multidrug efflux pump subunit AcrA (membrane-fusion protein)